MKDIQYYFAIQDHKTTDNSQGFQFGNLRFIAFLIALILKELLMNFIEAAIWTIMKEQFTRGFKHLTYVRDIYIKGLQQDIFF